MNEFTEDHSARLLSKEWLVKIDNERSIPYLMKLHPTFGNQSCVFMITDTKTVWAEVLSKQQLSRRWSTLNNNSAQSHLPHSNEDAWLDQVLQYLVDAHTPRVMGDLSFDVMTDSRYSVLDLAIHLRGEGFEWIWETFSIGPKQSAEVLSKHLMIPLLSTAYLAFTSPDVISEISGSGLEKMVDRVGRTARRSMDTHIRNVFSQPRACTTIRRLSALFAFSADLPAIIDEFENPEPALPSVDSAAGSPRTLNKTPTVRLPSVNSEHARSPKSRQMEIESGDEVHTKAMMTTRQGPGTGVLGRTTTGNPPPTEAGQDDDDDDGDILARSEKRSGKKKADDSRSIVARTAIQGSKPASRTSSNPASSVPGSRTPPASSAARSSALSKTSSSSTDSDSDSPPHPNKRARTKGQDRGGGDDSDGDDDSDDGAKRGELRWRGTKQPVKRVARRF